MPDSAAPALKNIFDADRFQHVAKELTKIDPKFPARRFLSHALRDLDALSLMQRMRRMSEALRATLPEKYPEALQRLRSLAPRINHGFVTLVLPDFVALAGLEYFDLSMEALKFFTPFGSSEFAVREFLRRDLGRSLAVLEQWARDPDPAVRRLASEGSRPRLPWSFRLERLVADPALAAPILETLKADSSLYVRKSVANHLNDIAKDHPAWVMERLEAWPLADPATAWIAKRGLRTLIKQGDHRALALIGAGAKPCVVVDEFSMTPRHVALGDRIVLSLVLRSTAETAQRLVVDYVVHYVKKSGATSPKVFKWKELALAPGASVSLRRSQCFRDFTTRVHHAGCHLVEVVVNGERLAREAFQLDTGRITVADAVAR